MSSGSSAEVALPLSSANSHSLSTHVSYSYISYNTGIGESLTVHPHRFLKNSFGFLSPLDGHEEPCSIRGRGRRCHSLNQSNRRLGFTPFPLYRLLNRTSCGSCGYELNLNSCNRNISVIDAKYGKSMKRGVISFFSIDESRFTQINKVRWLPHLPSKNSWRLFHRRTKLLCRNCGNYIGTAWNMDDTSSSTPFQMVKQSSATWDGISARRMYEIKIRSLRPLSYEVSTLLI